MMYKSVYKIIKSQKISMDGNFIDQPLPIKGINQISPFLLIHHWKNTLSGNQKQEQVGVPPHPHCGFSPVTFVFEGGVHHRDSLGNDEVIKSGGTQWLFSGKGVVHSERPDKEIVEKGGNLEFIQFWINSPSKNKHDQPYYRALTNETTPKYKDDNVEIGVVCGNWNNLTGPIQYYIDLLLLRIEMKNNSELSFEIPQNHNTILYLLSGKAEVNNVEKAEEKELVWFEKNGNSIKIKAKSNLKAIIFSGEPIHEPLYTYGPFVLNYENEIFEAMKKYNNGEMGSLIENF